MRGEFSKKRWGDSLRQLEFDVMDNGVVTIPVNTVATDEGWNCLEPLSCRHPWTCELPSEPQFEESEGS